MDRYNIALKKFEKPSENPAPSLEDKICFNCEDGPDIKIKPFRPSGNFLGRVGFVFNDPKCVFLGNRVHYLGDYYICKKGDCCRQSKPVMRYASCIVIYNKENQADLDLAEVGPWSFGITIFNEIVTLSKNNSLRTHDFILKYEDKNYLTNRWFIDESSSSLWQKNPEAILKRAQPILKNLESFIGKDGIDDLPSEAYKVQLKEKRYRSLREIRIPNNFFEDK